MSQLDPYISFHGNCREAMQFYAKAINADLEIQTFGDSPMKDQMPPESHNNILHSRLSKNNVTLFMGSDDMSADAPKVVGSVSLCYSGDLEDVKKAFANLSDGAAIKRDLVQEFFGTYGELVDKYGFRWMFQSDAKISE
jgi:PhnB protein